ncbi:MAG: M24 family metallopeptidase [Acidobacteria bacterium]|nr:M24 family metallopeptidase [Acidobacteriota bacterium]
MTGTRRRFLFGSAAALATTLVGGGRADSGTDHSAGEDKAASAGASKMGDSATLLRANPAHPKPATFDRLDQSWYRRAVRRLQEKMQEEGIDGTLLADRWNIIYYSGLWFTGTERPFLLFIPASGSDLTWFHPSLDRDLIDTSWIRDREIYFDFKHGRGAFPNEGRVQMGETINLQRWVLKGLRKRGQAGKVIGVDFPITDELRGTAADHLPKSRFRKIGELCERMRMVKTREEIALAQRAMNAFSQIHAFARDLLLARGTDATDFEIASETTRYGVDLIMKEIERDGRPHTAVGISVDIGVRSGVGTAYPHPNQFHYNRIKKGDALQVAGIVNIGGYGGELYRAYQIAPWDPVREKVWQVHTDCYHIQAEESAAGVTCSYVAKKVHDHQVKNGMADYIYHRPAHGQGSEGHQPPYIALGDHTMLQEGMTFSNEPGLYAPDLGFGYNHSDLVLVEKEHGLQMGSVPATKEWCFLRL